MPIRVFNGKYPIIAKTVFVDAMATVIGDVTLKDHVSIWPNVSIRGDLLPIVVAENSNIQDNSVIHTTEFFGQPEKGYDVIIGESVTVGHSAVIHGCHIGDRVLIGMGAIVLDGAIIENDVMLGAGSVVSPGKTLKSGFLYVGAPARVVRTLTKQEKTYIANNALRYKSIKDQHIQDASA